MIPTNFTNLSETYRSLSPPRESSDESNQGSDLGLNMKRKKEEQEAGPLSKRSKLALDGQSNQFSQVSLKTSAAFLQSNTSIEVPMEAPTAHHTPIIGFFERHLLNQFDQIKDCIFLNEHNFFINFKALESVCFAFITLSTEVDWEFVERLLDRSVNRTNLCRLLINSSMEFDKWDFAEKILIKAPEVFYVHNQFHINLSNMMLSSIGEIYINRNKAINLLKIFTKEVAFTSRLKLEFLEFCYQNNSTLTLDRGEVEDCLKNIETTTEFALFSNDYFLLLKMACKYNLEDVIAKNFQQENFKVELIKWRNLPHEPNLVNCVEIFKSILHFAKKSTVIFNELEKHIGAFFQNGFEYLLQNYDGASYYTLELFGLAIDIFPNNNEISDQLVIISELESHEVDPEFYEEKLADFLQDKYQFLIGNAIERKDLNYLKKYATIFLRNLFSTCSTNYLFIENLLNAIPPEDLQVFIFFSKKGPELLEFCCRELYVARNDTPKNSSTHIIDMLNFLKIPHNEPEGTLQEWETVLRYEEKRQKKSRCLSIFTAMHQKKSHIAMTRAFESVFYAIDAHAETPFNALPQELKNIITLKVLESCDVLASIPQELLLSRMQSWVDSQGLFIKKI
jgi:hypothetical protein